MTNRTNVPTAREIEVLIAVISYGSEEEAAAHLNIKRSTVDSHLQNLRNKSTTDTLAQLALWAIERGYWDGKRINPD